MARKRYGDGIFAAFGSAVAAVEAALQIQRDVSWPARDPPSMVPVLRRQAYLSAFRSSQRFKRQRNVRPDRRVSGVIHAATR